MGRAPPQGRGMASEEDPALRRKKEKEALAAATPTEEIEALVEQRERCRLKKEFAAADELREELRNLGVIILDKERPFRWKSLDGREGEVPSFHSLGAARGVGPHAALRALGRMQPCTLSREDIMAMVGERERYRLKKQFESADVVRNQLLSNGVEFGDRAGIWTTQDGSLSGPIPTFQELIDEVPPEEWQGEVVKLAAASGPSSGSAKREPALGCPRCGSKEHLSEAECNIPKRSREAVAEARSRESAADELERFLQQGSDFRRGPLASAAKRSRTGPGW